MKNKLERILTENKDRRICVCGVSSCGKTTMLKDLPNCLDLDEIAWKAAAPATKYQLSQTTHGMTFEEMRNKGIIRAWTKGQSKIWENHVYKFADEFEIKPGQPVFSAIPFRNADLIIHLDISDELLSERAKKRGRNPEKAIAAKTVLKRIISETDMPVIKLA